MLYFAVNEDGSEWVFDDAPIRDERLGMWFGKNKYVNSILLPTSTTKKICGNETSWEDGFITEENEWDYQ